MDKKYYLPELPYKLNALEPFMSEEQLTLHYKKHHQKYIDNANLKFDTFNVGGVILHNLFWGNLMPPLEKENKPDGVLAQALIDDFESFEKFKEEFSKAAESLQGSGWVALFYEKTANRLLIGQIKNHNFDIYPNATIIMVLDVWEHAYYVDYKNDRAKYIAAFWKALSWTEVNTRYQQL